jgi:septal ring factor EnvC (AmiA/AmiB activator)
MTPTATSHQAPAAAAPSATILQFPAPKRAAPAAASRPRPQVDERLARALASLNAAVQEQRKAVKDWQAAIGALKTSTTGLRDGLERYQSTLGKLADGVATLHDQARSLEKWAEKAETAQS